MPVISKKRLYLTADGKVVDEGDPQASTLLVAAGGVLSDADAKKYGVKGDEPVVYDAKADHEAKHGNETQAEADARHAAMLEGQPDPDGPAVAGERGRAKGEFKPLPEIDEDPVTTERTSEPKAAKAPAANKARSASHNKAD